jgi:hypothetical protein
MFGVQLRTKPEYIKHLLFCIMSVVGAKEEACVAKIYEQEQKITEINETGRGVLSISSILYVTEMDYKLFINLRHM